MKPGIVFVGEEFDEDDFDMCTGLWSAHWEDGPEYRQGPRRVSAQEAIAWGRDQADVVLVRSADSDVHYSAGARRPEPEESSDFPPWPEGQELPRRRASGLEYLDRAPSAAPVLWRVRGGGTLPGDVDSFVTSCASTLRADDTVADVLVAPRVTDDNGYEWVFVVRAATVDDAEVLAEHAIDRAVDRAFQTALRELRTDVYFDTYVRRPQPLDARDDTG
jgi:hypothetical protein